MDRYRDRLKKFIEEKYPTLFHDIDLFIDVLSERPLKAIVVNKRLVDDPALLKHYFNDNDKEFIEVSWSQHIFYSRSLNLGRDILYHLGLYYIMGLVNTVYPLLLPNMKYKLIIDLAASPGGKTFLISNHLYPYKPLIIANEPSQKRIPSLLSNIDRLQIDNVIVTRYSGENFPNLDDVSLVVFDAPCTNANLFYKNPSNVLQNLYSRVNYFSRIQKRVIKNTYEILESGGLLIYSTCTFTVEECEEVVDYGIKLGFKVVKPRNIPFKYKWGISEWNGRSFDRGVRETIRISPELNRESYHGNIGLIYLAILRKP